MLDLEMRLNDQQLTHPTQIAPDKIATPWTGLSWTDSMGVGPGQGGPDTALSVWVVKQQEVREDTLIVQALLFLRHPDIQSDVWATPC